MKGILTIVVPLLIMGLTFYISLNFTEYAMLIFNTLIAILSVLLLLYFIYHFGPKKYTKNIRKNMFSEKFESIYKNVCNMFWLKLNAIRAINSICMVVVFVSLIICIYMRQKGTLTEGILELIFLIIMMMGMLIAKNQTKYTELFKKNIVPSFMEMIFENVRYSRDERVREKVEKNYQASGFDSETTVRLKMNDYIEYSQGNSEIEIANIWAYEMPGNENDMTFFGLFAQTDSVKPIEQFIKISKNKLNKKKSKIDMDSSDFEEIFDIYAEDKIYAMRILTADVMMLLLDFYEKYEMKFEIILKEQKVYLRFYTGKIFEKKLFRNPMKKKNLFIYYSIMEFVVELTKSINKALEQIEL